MIIELQESDTQKIQLTITVKFISSKDAEEECVMYSKSSNIKFMLTHFIQDIKTILKNQ